MSWSPENQPVGLFPRGCLAELEYETAPHAILTHWFQTGGGAIPDNGFFALAVGIGRTFSDCQYSPELEGSSYFFNGGCASILRNFPEHCYQKRQIVGPFRESALTRRRMNRRDVTETAGSGAPLQLLNHALLDVETHDLPLVADDFCNRERKPPASTADVNYTHARRDLQVPHDAARMRPGDGVLEHPRQGC